MARIQIGKHTFSGFPTVKMDSDGKLFKGPKVPTDTDIVLDRIVKARRI